MNKEETYEQTKPIVINDATAQRWYDTGFKFALNYLIVWIPIVLGKGKKFNQENFKVLVKEAIGEKDNYGGKILDDDYFKNLHFYDTDNNYGSHQCPDPTDPTVCIPCTTRKMKPIPKP